MDQMMQIQGAIWFWELIKTFASRRFLKKSLFVLETGTQSESKSKINLFLPCEWNSQISFQTLPCTFSSLNCYPQINKANKAFVLATKPQKCERTSTFLLKLWPAVRISSWWNCLSKAKRTPPHLHCTDQPWLKKTNTYFAAVQLENLFFARRNVKQPIGIRINALMSY